MSIPEQIENERETLHALCNRIGVSALTARIDGDSREDVTFIGDIDIQRLKGYAARFFELEEGLVRVFHRPVRLVDAEGVRSAAQRNMRSSFADSAASIELLHAS